MNGFLILLDSWMADLRSCIYSINCLKESSVNFLGTPCQFTKRSRKVEVLCMLNHCILEMDFRNLKDTEILWDYLSKMNIFVFIFFAPFGKIGGWHRRVGVFLLYSYMYMAKCIFISNIKRDAMTSTLPHVSQETTLFCKLIQVWEPPTKQFYPECQPSSNLSPRQSVRSIAAPTTIG
jgi:hypothetical protein